jgi:two-component system sensor histidine kinase QseC
VSEPARSWSLRARLLALLVALSCGVMLAATSITWMRARTLSRQLYDDSLRHTASLLLQLAQYEIEEHGMALGVALVRAEALPGVYDFRFQLWTADMRDAYRRGRTPVPPFMPLDATGYGWTRIDGTSWRTYAVWNERHTMQLQIAESLGYRESFPRSLLWELAAALALLLPAGVMLVWWILASSFRTVRSTARVVAARAADDLDPVPVSNLPQEMAPLLASFNRLLQRVRDTLLLERRFTADAAHELRTPLAAIRASAQVMQGARDADEFDDAATDLLSSVDRGTRLMEQLLSLTRIDASAHLAGALGDVDLEAVVQVQVDEQEHFAGQFDIGIRAEAAPVHAHGDFNLLSVLLRNLIDNAIRYSPPDTEITVCCAMEAGGPVLRVSDQGPGVPDALRSRIFERFFRASNAAGYGSGLGLSIVQRIAEIHGARVEVATGPDGRGACFTIHLQRSRNEPAAG